MRVSLAGFGGALAGLSFARRGASSSTAVRQVSSALTKNNNPSSAANNNSGKKRLQRQQRPIIRSTPPTTTPFVDRELPTAWAVACMAFAGIIECTRMMSPTTFAWELVNYMSGPGPETDNSDTQNADDTTTTRTESLDPSTAKISDYTIGGVIAGALFKGSAVRTKTGARIDASIMGISSQPSSNLKSIKGRPLSGMLPGAALGLLAGISIVAIEHAQNTIEERFSNLDDDELGVKRRNEDSSIPEDIKRMTNEELMASIEALKRGEKEKFPASSSSSSTTSTTDTSQTEEVEGKVDDDHEKVRDLISSLGFRPHPS